MNGDRPVESFRQIALGSSGAGIKFKRGDNKTPLGVFRVGWINDHSRFKTFIGLDYPNPDYAERALRERRIDALTYERIRAAWSKGRTPPQDTPLGGQIGIHGVGAGNPGVHSAGINWTSGCIALDNRQIDAPVSYTHLDVYKRQAVRYAPRKDEQNPAETPFQVRLVRGGQESVFKGAIRPNATVPVTTFTVER